MGLITLAGVALIYAMIVYPSRSVPSVESYAIPSSQKPLSPEELYARLAPSVVSVEIVDRRGQVETRGSGVSIGGDQVVTNSHVLSGARRARVKQGRKTWNADVVRCDKEEDLCVLQATGFHGRALPLRRVGTLAVGERVYAIGSPIGLEASLSEGIISGLRILSAISLIQTTAPISHGSSGGGLFDRDGRVVGITTFMIAPGQNLNFAVSSDGIPALRQTESPIIEDLGPAPPVVAPPSVRQVESPTYESTRIATGTNLDPIRGFAGRGKLRITNGTSSDATVRLFDTAEGETLRFVYVRAGDEVVVGKIGPCRCILKFSAGKDWDSKSRRFQIGADFWQFDVEEFEAGEQIHWRTFEVTLHPVPEGHAKTTHISEEEFSR